MSVDNARIVELAREIGKTVESLAVEGSILSNKGCDDLIRYAEELATAARKPEENLYYQATQGRLPSEWNLDAER